MHPVDSTHEWSGCLCFESCAEYPVRGPWYNQSNARICVAQRKFRPRGAREAPLRSWMRAGGRSRAGPRVSGSVVSAHRLAMGVPWATHGPSARYAAHGTMRRWPSRRASSSASHPIRRGGSTRRCSIEISPREALRNLDDVRRMPPESAFANVSRSRPTHAVVAARVGAQA